MMNIKRNILLNPGPGTTSDAVKMAMLVPDICPREEEFCRVMESIKLDLPKVVNGGDDYTSVLFTASGTGGVEAALTSAVPADGKLLIIENGAYGTRQCHIAEYYRIPYVSYKMAYGDYPDLGEVERYLKSDPAITHVSMVHHETTTGMLNPVGGICRLSHAYGKEVIVDTVSSFAGVHIDLQEWQAEYIVSSSNKCIQGMPGLSFVIFKKSLLEQIKGAVGAIILTFMPNIPVSATRGRCSLPLRCRWCMHSGKRSTFFSRKRPGDVSAATVRITRLYIMV